MYVGVAVAENDLMAGMEHDFAIPADDDDPFALPDTGDTTRVITGNNTLI